MSNPTSFSSIIFGSGSVQGEIRGTQHLYSPSGYYSLSLSSGKIYDRNLPVFDAASQNLYAVSTFIDPPYDLYENGISISWSSRLLYNQYGDHTLNYHQCALYSTGLDMGSPQPINSLNWLTRKLYANSGNIQVMDYSSLSGLQICCPQGTGAFIPLNSNMFTVQVNETTNKLNFVVKYSNGSVKSGSMNLS